MNGYDPYTANNGTMQPSQHQGEGARPPPKRRNRKAVSCVSCREKKIKCDRVVPCNQCIKRGEQDQCRIEQKPKIVHDHSHQHAPTHPPSYIDPLSPGSAAYSQFSAAISTARSQVNAAQSSSSPPPAEVEAIKARLAQVEALLAGQIPLSSANALAPSSPMGSSNWNAYRSSSSGSGARAVESNVSRGSSQSPSSFTSAHRSASGSTHHSSVSPHDGPYDTDESESEEDTAPSSPRAPISRLRTDDMPVSRKEMDSDTEDAATVLERLAMDGSSNSRWAKATNGCPTQNAASRGAAEGKSEHCERMQQEVDSREATGEKFELCLQRDKEFDLMSIDKHAVGGVVSVPSEGQQGPTEMLLPPVSRAPDLDAGANGQPPCACRDPDADGTTSNGHDHTQDYTCLKQNEPVSKEPSPITVPCKLACENKGLLRLKSGPETLFGWGMGWAWSAAEVLLQQDKRKAKEEGRTFVVSTRTEREAVLRAICESLPSKQIAYQLIEVYESRARYLCGHVVHVPCLKREVEAFYALETAEKRARVVNHIDCSWLSLFLMVLALGVRFYPCQPKAGWLPANHLFDGKTIHAWHSAAKTCLVLANYLNSNSMSVLQSISLLYLFHSVSAASCGGEADSGTTHTALLRTAITNAQDMGLHRLGDLDKQPRANEPSAKVIRRQIGMRIWWHLVFLDWSAAGTGCAKDYFIRSDSFNTPLPGNYNDDDLMRMPLPAPRPREEFTEMSYVLSNLEFGMAVKQDVDVRQRRELQAATSGGDRRLTCVEAQRLDALYRGVLENTPSFFKVGSEIGQVTCIEVQRWLLQQAVFSKLLRIHRPNLSSRKESRTNCVLLARSILDMQKKIRSRCTVIDRLWQNLMQSFSAAIVLALHLLHTRPSADHRVSVRSEITEAIRALKQVDGTDCAAKKCIRVIEALLDEEEERWQAGNAALARNDNVPMEAVKLKRKRQMDVDGAEDEVAASGGKRKNLLSLAQRVAQATREDASARQNRSAPADDPSKRQATLAAVRSASGTENSGALEVNGVAALKDDASLYRMNNTTLPTSGPSPLNMTAASSNQDDVTFPQMLQTMPFPSNLFNFNDVNASQRMVPPNGVDLMLNNPITPPDGQSFDLAAFLEQVSNSPGSSTDFSLSSGHEDRSASTSSDVSGMDDRGSASALSNGDGTDNTSVSSFGEPLLTKEAIRRQQQHLQANTNSNLLGSNMAPAGQTGGFGLGPQAISPVSATARPDPSTDMDSFWNWIITQGANGITAPTTMPTTQAAPVLMQQPALAAPPSQKQPVQYGMPSTLPPTPQSAHSGLTPYLAPNTGYFNSNEGYPTPSSLASGTKFGTPASQPAVSATPEAQRAAPTAGVVGTPSAGFSLDSFLGAPLYDFSDYANAWTASNPGSVPMGAGPGPVSDP
ncbi:Zn(2)-C6 fungal-type DNA-binding domain protein [Kalmanozyma brasiliensis GHG001]|uniref:Zn(2)-C6 fungal-type domain-containing protein n=1 Tax=Kalmanozyma brasiliensis (strain GHG001) TaxID=1365824 RepID=V5EMS3_KALBG|nr:Zn(2)-C6 fungal-type DNA-binding domain protein [Kalmanozyma brasiliensis GHG001]EST06430.1 Zn(2)-C6 fungal-type DNA-binding domain protein [Kalmanozyma brasiliensis GHG001]